MRHRFAALFCAFLTFFLIPATSPAQAPSGPVSIRVGVAEYQDLAEQLQNYRTLFRELEAADPSRFRFTLAIGSYGEVLDWYNRQEIDVAVFAAMPMARLLASAKPDERSHIYSMYVATLQETEPNRAKALRLSEVLDNGARFREWDKTHYRPVMVVRQDSPIRTTDDILKYRDQVSFLFVRPFSVSGYIAPSYFLHKELNLSEPAKLGQRDWIEQKSRFTFEHVNSLKRLAKGDQYQIAFVYDGVSVCTDKDQWPGCDPGRPSLHAVETVGKDVRPLEEMLVPFNSVVVNHLLPSAQQQQYWSFLRDAFEKRRLHQASLERDQKQQASVHFIAQKVPEQQWVEEHLQVNRWANEPSQMPSRLLYRTDLDHLFRELAQFEQVSGQKPRLAVVLSGGGAKCAFQAGAIMALEEKIQELHRNPRSPLKDFDIGLVVGTSGGAVNAMLMATGITAENKVEEIRSVWGSMTEDQFFRPSLRFRIAFGVLIAATQIALVLLATTLFNVAGFSWRSTATIITSLFVIHAFLALYLTVQPFSSFLRFSWIFLLEMFTLVLARILIRAFGRWFPGNLQLAGFLLVAIAIPQLVIALFVHGSQTAALSHNLAHIMMLVVFAGKWAAPISLVAGLALLKIHHLDRFWADHRVILRFTAAVAAVFLVISILTLIREESPSRPDGIREFLSTHMSTFLSNRNVTPVYSSKLEDRLRSISQQIIEHPKLLRRDLIIAATKLPPVTNPECASQDVSCNGSGASVGADVSSPDADPVLYFYALRDGSEKDVDFHHDQHFVSLRDNKEDLLDVVVGSSTIYPVFPPLQLEGVKLGNSDAQKTERLRIVDGGYSHNTPILAALQWHATHLLLIEASPESIAMPPHDFFDNAGAAFNFLFDEAQRLDTLSRGQVEVFSIRPRSQCWQIIKLRDCSMAPDPDLDTFDFYPRLLTDAFQRGFEEAKAKYPDAIGNFVREPGEPILTPVTSTVQLAARQGGLTQPGRTRSASPNSGNFRVGASVPGSAATKMH